MEKSVTCRPQPLELQMDLSDDQKKELTPTQLPIKSGAVAPITVGILLGTLVLWGALASALLWFAGKQANLESALSGLVNVLLASNALFSGVAFAGGVWGLIYLKRQFVIQQNAIERLQIEQSQQTALVTEQLSRMEAVWSRHRAEDDAMAEPQLNSKGGDTGENIKRVEFENAGATVMELSIQCETPGFFAELQPRLVLRSSDCGHVNIVGCNGKTDADVALTISYVTHLGKRSSKRFVVPAGNHALVESPGC